MTVPGLIRDELLDLLWSISEGNASACDIARLEELAGLHPEIISCYAQYTAMCGLLSWERNETAAGEFPREAISSAMDFPADGAILPANGLFVAPVEETPCCPTSAPRRPALDQFAQFIDRPVFSYLVASVILCLMFWGGWAYKISHDYGPSLEQNSSYAKNSRGSTTPGLSTRQNPAPVFVARVTGMKDCRWADPATETYTGAFVPLGRKYALSSGLMEITYLSGAKVILEGPCSYEIESDRGGFLALGKLTARVEERSEVGGQRSEAGGPAASAASVMPQTSNLPSPNGRGAEGEGNGNQKQSALTLTLSGHHEVVVERGPDSSPKPQAPSPKTEISKSPNLQISKFTVRTPTAVVTDLGTEFGVEVGAEGRCDVRVFAGVVEAVPLREGRPAGKPQRLVAGQLCSIRAQVGDVKVNVSAAAADPNRFIRELPALLICRHQIGAAGEFAAAADDLIAAGQPALSKIALTSGEAIMSSGVEKLNDGDVYGAKWEGNTRETFTPTDGAAVVIELNTTLHPGGYDIASVVVLTGSAGPARRQQRTSQKFDLAYSTAREPNVFIPLHCDKDVTVDRDALGWPEMQTKLMGMGGVSIARGAARLRLTFHDTGSPNPESMYREIDVYGSPADADSASAPKEFNGEDEITKDVSAPSSNRNEARPSRK